MSRRPLSELERAVYEDPAGRHCCLVLVVGAHGDGAGRRDLHRDGDRVLVCYLEDGRIPQAGAMEWASVDPSTLRRCGELIDARSMT